MGRELIDGEIMKSSSNELFVSCSERYNSPSVRHPAAGEADRRRSTVEIDYNCRSGRISGGNVSDRNHPAYTYSSVVAVAVNASKMNRCALEWALCNVVRPGDLITLLALWPAVRRLQWSLPSLMFSATDCTPRLSVRAASTHHPKSIHDMEDEISGCCESMMADLHDLCDVAKTAEVKVKVIIPADGEKGAVAMECERMGAKWVVLDRHVMKREGKMCVEQLRCNVVLVKEAMNSKILRLNLRSISQHHNDVDSASNHSNNDEIRRVAAATNHSKHITNHYYELQEVVKPDDVDDDDKYRGASPKDRSKGRSNSGVEVHGGKSGISMLNSVHGDQNPSATEIKYVKSRLVTPSPSSSSGRSVRLHGDHSENSTPVDIIAADQETNIINMFRAAATQLPSGPCKRTEKTKKKVVQAKCGIRLSFSSSTTTNRNSNEEEEEEEEEIEDEEGSGAQVITMSGSGSSCSHPPVDCSSSPSSTCRSLQQNVIHHSNTKNLQLQLQQEEDKITPSPSSSTLLLMPTNHVMSSTIGGATGSRRYNYMCTANSSSSSSSSALLQKYVHAAAATSPSSREYFHDYNCGSIRSTPPIISELSTISSVDSPASYDDHRSSSVRYRSKEPSAAAPAIDNSPGRRSGSSSSFRTAVAAVVTMNGSLCMASSNLMSRSASDSSAMIQRQLSDRTAGVNISSRRRSIGPVSGHSGSRRYGSSTTMELLRKFNEWDHQASMNSKESQIYRIRGNEEEGGRMLATAASSRKKVGGSSSSSEVRRRRRRRRELDNGGAAGRVGEFEEEWGYDNTKYNNLEEDLEPEYCCSGVDDDDVSPAIRIRSICKVPLISPPEPPPLCSICRNKAPAFGTPPRRFSYRELERATGGFSAANFLAEGGFGSVHRGVLGDGQAVAVKQQKAAAAAAMARNGGGGGGGQGEAEFLAEVEVLSCAQHRNVVMLIGYCMERGRRLLVYEFVCNGSLDAHLYPAAAPPAAAGGGAAALPWSARRKVAVGAARGLRYLHEECRVGCVVHRDLRPNNILLTHDYEPMVGDFGLARWQPDGDLAVQTRVIGTFGYLAPEYAQSGEITDKADVFSYGVVLVELVTGRKAIDISRPKGEQCLTEWARPLLEESPGVDALLAEEFADPRLHGNYNLEELRRCLHAASLCIRKDPHLRPRMSQVLRILEGDVIIDTTDLDRSPTHFGETTVKIGKNITCSEVIEAMTEQSGRRPAYK